MCGDIEKAESGKKIVFCSRTRKSDSFWVEIIIIGLKE